MKKILSLLLVSSSIFSMQLECIKKHPRISKIQQKLTLNGFSASGLHKEYIKPSSLFIPQRLGQLNLSHGKDGFVVHHEGKKHYIQKCFMDKPLRTITPKQLKAFQKIGYLYVNQMDDGEFLLKARVRGNGGGPIFGGFMYWLTKSLCYGGLATAAGATVVGTGGAVVAAVAGPAVATGAGTVTALAIAGSSASTAVTGVAVATTSTAAIITTAGVGVATAGTGVAVGVGAGAVVTAAGATTAGAVITKASVVGVTTLVGSGVSIGGIVAGIEVASTAVGTFFGMLPFTP